MRVARSDERHKMSRFERYKRRASSTHTHTHMLTHFTADIKRPLSQTNQHDAPTATDTDTHTHTHKHAHRCRQRGEKHTRTRNSQACAIVFFPPCGANGPNVNRANRKKKLRETQKGCFFLSALQMRPRLHACLIVYTIH